METISESDKKLNRRELLGYGWLTMLGVLALGAAKSLIDFSLPRARKGEFGGLIEIGTASDLPSPKDPPLNHPKGKFWLVNTNKGLMAFYKACTHLDCLFDWNKQEGRFICPCHGSKFSREGDVLTGPATRSLDRFIVQIVGKNGEVLVQSDADSAGPLLFQLESKKSVIRPGPSLQNTTVFVPEDAIVRVDTGRKISVKPDIT